MASASKLILKNIFFTSYNPVPEQTDATPCIAGGTGMNLCDMAKDGIRTIALSQELTAWSKLGQARKRINCGKGCVTIEGGQRVILKSTNYPDDSRCNGQFLVADAMNLRYRKRGDIFMLDRADNVSCRADVYSID